MVSEDSASLSAPNWTRVGASRWRSFLLIVRTGRIVTNWSRLDQRVAPDTRIFQHIARFCNGLKQPQWELGDSPKPPGLGLAPEAWLGGSVDR